MERFEYEISLHTSDEFRTLAYFCSPTGQCDLHDGMLAIWKRRLA